MNEKDWLLIKTLYEEHNISYAAKRLFISQPALSDRIKRLEQEFGCKITVRHPRGISFTHEGQLLYQYALEQLTAYEQIKESLTRPQTTKGLIKIGASTMFAKYLLPRKLADFKKIYPDMEFLIKTGYSHDLFKDFLEGHLHLCIVRGNHNWNEAKTLLWEEALALFSATPVKLEDMAHKPYIHYTTDPLLQAVLDEWWYARFTSPPMTTIEVDSMSMALELVSEELGFTILSESCHTDHEHLHMQPLTFVNGETLTRQTYLYYRHNYEQFTATKAFVEFMKRSAISIAKKAEEI